MKQRSGVLWWIQPKDIKEVTAIIKDLEYLSQENARRDGRGIQGPFSFFFPPHFLDVPRVLGSNTEQGCDVPRMASGGLLGASAEHRSDGRVPHFLDVPRALGSNTEHLHDVHIPVRYDPPFARHHTLTKVPISGKLYNLGMDPRDKVAEQGIHPHPGPSSAKKRAKYKEGVRRKGYVNFTIGNVSNFLGELDNFKESAADIYIGQEHSISPFKVKEAKGKLDKQWNVHFSHLDPEADNLGGLFAMTKGNMDFFCPKRKVRDSRISMG